LTAASRPVRHKPGQQFLGSLGVATLDGIENARNLSHHTHMLMSHLYPYELETQIQNPEFDLRLALA
jgi:hypothetical protein